MSRETDSSSSGPHARGGAAYPPGTEPYGPPPAGAGSEHADRAEPESAAPQPDEQKTETTLTTHVRINIPGSRPIPPVVVRKPVGEDAGDDGREPARPEAGPSGTPAHGGPAGATGAARGADGAAGEDPESSDGGRQVSSWFAPRKPPNSAKSGSTGPAPTPGAGPPAEPPYRSEPPPEPPRRGDTPDGGFPAAPPPVPDMPSGPTAGPATGDMPLLPPEFRHHGPGSGTVPHQRGEDMPPQGAYEAHAPAGAGSRPADGEVPDFGDLVPPADSAGPSRSEDTGGFGRPGDPDGTGSVVGAGDFGGFGDFKHFDDFGDVGGSARTGAPAGPADAAGPADTAGNAANRAEAAEAAESATAAAAALFDNLDRPTASGESLVGGIPVVPPGGGREDEQADDESAAPEPDPLPARRGRSRLVLVGAAVLCVLGIAYGTGLLLDHADVPNGTTVLGVDIGGTSTEEAVDRLDDALGERAAAPLLLEVQGEEKSLKPDVAGLSLDTEATVQNASGPDYNPVSVIGSLLGGSRQAKPVFVTDEEKLKAALESLSDQVSGDSGQDGMVKFVDGRAVGVPGKPHKGVDIDESAELVEEAYRNRAATGANPTVELPVSLQQPEVDKAEIERAIREFGEPAMSGMVTVKAGDVSIPFSPTGSLPKFLSMKPVDGKLVDTYDLDVLKELYGSTFDGILIARGNGTRTPVTPQDVAGALRQALRETDPAQRVGVIPLDPQ